MTREIWATYAVNDHCRPRAFLADVMLYDRLVLPVPPDKDEGEWQRWQDAGWDPQRQKDLLAALGPLARTVPWDSQQQALWTTRMEATKDGMASYLPDYAFYATRTVLTAGLPNYVTGVEALGIAYSSLDDLVQGVGIREHEDRTALPGGTLGAVIGRRFHIPEDSGQSDEELLRSAAALAQDNDFRNKRDAVSRFQQEFLKGGRTDAESVTAAVKKLDELLEQERKALDAKHVQVSARYAFCIAPLALSLALLPVAGPLAPAVGILGGGFISLGGIVVDEWLGKKAGPDLPTLLAFFQDADRHFGWR